MLDKAKVVSISEIQHQQIAQWLTPGYLNHGFSYAPNEKTFTLSGLYDKESSSLELVIFGDLTVNHFADLITQCQISLQKLLKINHRNHLTSYRFSVDVVELKAAREKLSQFNLTHNIESALLLNAPALSTPGLLVMDMDSTAIKIECIDEIAALAGVGEEVAQVTELAMQGKLDFRESLYQRVGKLANAPESILASVVSTLPLMEGLETLTLALKQHQWRIAIASGGFTYFADHLKDLLALDVALANTLEIKDGHLTGMVLGDVIDAQAKASCLTSLQQSFDIAPTQTVAMGDGANDLVMMSVAQLGVAHHAKPVVLAQADSCITHSGLDCLLHWLK